MDYQKAIETLQDIHDVAEVRIKSGDTRGVVYIPSEKIKDIESVLSAMEELKLYKENKLCLVPEDVYGKQCTELDEYKQLGTLEEVQEAVERLQPKAPNWHMNPVMEHGKLPVCPTCNTIMVRTEILGRTIDEHCVTCGQAIDWSVSE